MKFNPRCLFVVGWVLGLSPADAAWVVDSRRTELRMATQFGYVGSVNTGVDSLVRTGLTEDLQVNLRGSDSGSGSVGDTSWVASYDYSLDQSLEYLPEGGFSASGSISLYAFSGDQGIAMLDAQPGNRLDLGFSLSADERYEFSGIAPELTKITLEQSLGNGQWTPIAEPGTEPFRYVFGLTAGQYRVSAVGSGYYDLSQGAGSSWSVQLATIPEPVSGVLFGSSLLAGTALFHRARTRANRRHIVPARRSALGMMS